MSNISVIFLCFLFGLLMFILGMVHARKLMTKVPDGTFFINLQDPNEETMKLQIDLAIEEIPRQKYLIFKIQKTE